MTDCYSFHSGTLPLLVSVPHDGRQLPGEIGALMSAAGRSLSDTDWHVARLYAFVKDLGASTIVANYSRYVVDLNRPADDSALYEGRLVTGLCPTKTFGGEAIYADKIAIDIDDRIQTYWRPYHDKISAVLGGFRESHGYALLWDAHSISSRVPALFDGELPLLNLGTWDGKSCDQTIVNALIQVAQESRYDTVLNARFKGGYITRHYGDPKVNVHAVQLEIAQRAYLDEATKAYDTTKASQLRDTLQCFIETFTKVAKTRL